MLSSKWVLTIKRKYDGNVRYTARLVARGLEDILKEYASSDAPTASSSTQRLVLVALVENQWPPQSIDFETEILEGGK